MDDLHERAGSTNVIHLHGELTKLRSHSNRYPGPLWGHTEDYTHTIKLGDEGPEGGQLRPDIVWFGEELDPHCLDKTRKAAEEADICIIVGTSMQVMPAASIPFLTKETTLIYYVDPGDVEFSIPKIRKFFFYHFEDDATVGVKKVYEDLQKIAERNKNKK